MICTRKNGGFTILHVLTAIIIITVLMGMMTVGMIKLKENAEVTTLIGRANQFGQALQMFYTDHRQFPTAYPASLETDLAPYLNNKNIFSTTADNSTGPDALNATYIQPSSADPEAYVMSFESKYNSDKAVVLFADGTAEAVEELDIMYNDQTVQPGTTITDNRVSLGSGSLAAPLNGTSVKVVQSFITNDGSPYDILKVEQGNDIHLDVLSTSSSMVVVGTEFGNTTVRDGGMNITRIDATPTDVEKVTAYFGEVVTECGVVSRGGLPTFAAGYDASGSVNLNPNNSSEFEFQLTKPDGTMITRDNVLASGSTFSYSGPATSVRFKPKGNGNQNQLVINKQVYPLKNGTLYTLTASTMTLRLYNDKAGKGNAMGRWWLDNIVATNARLVEGDEQVAQQSTGFTLGTVALSDSSLDSNVIRTLSHGTIVRPNFWITGR